MLYFLSPAILRKGFMARFRFSVFFLLLLLLGSLVTPAHAQSNIQVISDTASNTFPESIDFKAEFQSGANITSAVLEYGVDQLTCGTVEAKAFPTFTPAATVKVEWTWEMRQSTSLAPGVSVWWRWQVSDASGKQFTTSTQSILWLDGVHPWQVIKGGNINLHYYNGGASFGQQLHDTAVKALVRLSQDVGVGTNSPVDIYIYANQKDLQEAVLFEPSWAGGQGFAENNIVIIGISPDQLDWGKSTETHELTHVLVGHLTFSCLGFIPQWLNEGLAVYAEGGPHAGEQTLLDQAVASNTLMSLRSLTGNFPSTSSGYLAYGEAYSVVNFLIKTYGRDKITTLLLDLRDGATADAALQGVYGFNVDGLEDAWRHNIGAASRTGTLQPTQLSMPTQVPTIVPIGAAPVAGTDLSTAHPAAPDAVVTPAEAPQTAVPTVTSVPTAEQPGPGATNFPIAIAIGLAFPVIVVLLAGLAIFLIVRRQNRSGK
jgi:hypothetical protein